MKLYQSGSFARRVKKINQGQKAELDKVIRQIIGNPVMGEKKKGDLSGVFIHKFSLENQTYLLAYRYVDGKVLELIMLGPHENYYRDLKRYLKN